MSLDSLPSVLSQIEYLVGALNKKGAKNTEVFEWVGQVIGSWGREAEVHLLRSLLSTIDFNLDNRGQHKDSPLIQYLRQIFETNAVLKPKPGFLSSFCAAYDRPLKQNSRLWTYSLQQIAQVLRLNPTQRVIFGLCFLKSKHQEARKNATAFLRKELPELLRAYIDPSAEGAAEGTGLEECGVEGIHSLLTFLHQLHLDLENFGVPEDLRQSFNDVLRKDFPKEAVPAVLLPLLSCDSEAVPGHPEAKDFGSIEMSGLRFSGSLALQIKEIGLAFTGSMENCRQHLQLLGGADVATPSAIAATLTMMIKTHFENAAAQGWTEEEAAERPTWNIAIFTRVLIENVPNLDWREVIIELDEPRFKVSDRKALSLLMQSLFEGLSHSQAPFPVHLLLRDWINKEGQCSWIYQILANSDIFCFVEHPHRAVMQLEILKQPVDEIKKEIATWRSLDLVECLLKLSDAPGLFRSVFEIFMYPMQHCPDLLALNLLQIPPPINAMRQELLQQVVSVFFGNHPNSSAILSYAWNTTLLSQNHVRSIIMNAMAAWCLKHQDDPHKLNRILDLAQELKAILSLANSKHGGFYFNVDIACLAARRDFLNLTQWLPGKIHEHGEPFVAACLMVLKKRTSSCVGSGSASDKAQTLNQLSGDISALLTCLNSVSTTVSPALSTEISQVMAACQQSMGRVGGGGGGIQALTPTIPGRSTPTTSVTPFGAPPQQSRGNSAVDIFSTQQQNPGFHSLNRQISENKAAFGGMGLGSVGSSMMESGASQATLRPQFQATTPTPTSMFGGPQASVSPSRSMLSSVFGAPSRVNATSGSSGGWTGQGGISFRAPTAAPSAPGPASNPTATGLFSGSVSQGTIGVGGLGNIPDIGQKFSDDVQEQANGYFQHIYSHPPQPSMSIEEFIEILKKFRDSFNRKEKEVFSCMLKNLFEEYRFFPDYPDRELHTTALVYGSIIREDILSGMHRAFAMRAVMVGVKSDYLSKMYWFGVVALNQFRKSLKSHAGYCKAIQSLPHFQKIPQHLIDYINAGVEEQEPKNPSPEAAVMSPALHGKIPVTGANVEVGGTTTPNFSLPGSKSFQPKNSLASANIHTLVSATEKEESSIQDPPESVLEKVAFLFNNLSQANLYTKVEELWKSILQEKEDFLPWLSQYLVMKRVSIEPNFHNLYFNFINAFDNKTFDKIVMKETYRNIKILLRSDKRQAVANFSDRQLLKNLGHWLGLITLGKNRPILYMDLDIKSLLLEGYYKGQHELLYVVPFVAHILKSCQRSKIFQYPNPFTAAILNVLAELHQEPDLKLNLKFEIEVLCKDLSVDLTKLKPKTLLKDISERISQTQFKQQLDDVTALTKQPDPDFTTGTSPLPAALAAGVTTGVEALSLHSVPSQAPPPPAQDEGHAATGNGSPAPPPARFSYHDINVTSFAGLAPHLNINHGLLLFQMNPPLKNLVRPAIEHAVKELITPVAERAIKVAMTSTEHVVKKDFALEPDEGRMRAAAHQMVRSLTAGMAMITCREPLLITIQGYLKQAFYSSLRGANTEQQRMIEEAAVALSEDNVELGQCFIVKSACEKAIPEVDKKLEHEFNMRRQAKTENRRYCDPNTLTYHAESMPEKIALKVGNVTPHMQEIYKQFTYNICGFKPTTADDLIVGFPETGNRAPGPQAGQGVQVTAVSGEEQQLELIYQRLIREMDGCISTAQPTSVAAKALRSIREALAIAAQQPKNSVGAQSLVQKLVEILLDSYSAQSTEPEWMVRLRDAFLVSMRVVSSIFGLQWLKDMITKVLIDCRQDYRYNLDAIDVLIRSKFVLMSKYDHKLANSMGENGMNFQAVNFAQRLIKLYFIEESGQNFVVSDDLTNTIEMLCRIQQYHNSNRTGEMGLQFLLDTLTKGDDGQVNSSNSQTRVGNGFDVLSNMSVPSNNLASAQRMMDRAPGAASQSMGLGGGGKLGEGREDETDLQVKAENILRDWLPIAYSSGYVKEPQKAFQMIVQSMHQHGILRTDEMITRFFRLCTEMCVDLTYRLVGDPSAPPQVIRSRCFYTLDAYVRLISVLVKHSGDGQFATKINLLNKVLGVVANVLMLDHDMRKVSGEFYPLPFHRILIMLFWELTTPDQLLDPINFQILTSFCNTLHVLQPRKAPGFAYAWLDIVGHRAFIGRMLVMTPQQKAWAMYAQLVIDHLKFLSPFLRNIDLPKPIALMYKGTLRALLVLLHDFPELLCDYHYLLCDVIPPNCVQLRNLILSAYPRQMRLPDPFMPNLKVDQLQDINQSPKITVTLKQIIQAELQDSLDSYLRNRGPVSFINDLRSKLQVTDEPGQKYNVSLMNAVVLYVGIQAIEAIQEKQQRPNMSTIAHTAYMDIFQSLAVNLDTEGRYLFFNAIANQLRYPNSHTHYFSQTLLYLFLEANQEVIQEQITRILFERLVALRPHPWGLLITFIELIKNPKYNFWSHEFVSCAPEIERLFKSVAHSCVNRQSIGQSEAAHRP